VKISTSANILPITIFVCCTIGCNNQSDKTQAAQATEVTYPVFEDDLESQWDVTDIEEQLNFLVQSPFPISKDIVDGYLTLMQQGDWLCPGDAYELNPDLINGCSASTGYYYHGIAECFLTEDFDFVFENLSAETIQLPDLENWTTENGYFLVGDFEILRPNGIPFSAGGWVMDGRFKRDSDDILFGGITGSWKDEEGENQWHKDGVSGLFFYLMEPNLLKFDGVINLYGTHLRFVDFQVETACSTGFQGLLEIRDPNGRWHKLSSNSVCSCATHSYQGITSDEEVCIDWSIVFEGYQEHLEEL
jgi:hypothetical protein